MAHRLITQQRWVEGTVGGQRFGEMEVWGWRRWRRAYLQNSDCKSDDVGKVKIYEAIVKVVADFDRVAESFMSGARSSSHFVST